MRSGVTIRGATAEDAEAIGAIYDDAIATGIATFATGPHDAAERRAWLAARPENAPVYVAERADDGVVAWGALAPYSHREWYSGVAEYTVYVDANARAKGVGVEMLERVIAEAPQLGYWKLVGMILPENTPGLRLAARAGFRVVGTHVAHGRIAGQWRDVTLVERHLEDGARPGAAT